MLLTIALLLSGGGVCSQYVQQFQRQQQQFWQSQQQTQLPAFQQQRFYQPQPQQQFTVPQQTFQPQYRPNNFQQQGGYIQQRPAAQQFVPQQQQQQRPQYQQQQQQQQQQYQILPDKREEWGEPLKPTRHAFSTQQQQQQQRPQYNIRPQYQQNVARPQQYQQPRIQPQYQANQPMPQQYQPQQQQQQQQQIVYQQTQQGPPQSVPQQAYREPTVVQQNQLRLQYQQASAMNSQHRVLELQAHAPPPPSKFVPYAKDIYLSGDRALNTAPVTIIDTDTQVMPHEIIVDGHHESYIENVQSIAPPPIMIKRIKPNQLKIKEQKVTRNIIMPKTINRPKPAVATATAFVTPKVHPQPTQVHRPVSRVVVEKPRPSPVATKKVPKKGKKVPMTEEGANEAFLGCCKRRNVNKACERICNFDVLNKKTLTGMFLGTDKCPQSNGLDLMQCAASEDDHTACCIAKGVTRTSAGNKCLGFCNMKPGVTFQADVSMLPCWGVLTDIKNCFKKAIIQG